MAMCKESFGKESEQFVRIVTSAPEPMCILCTDSQLFDVERFCTGSGNFCPLTIDPTFDLGDFSVTVTCYRHLLLQNHQNAAKSPVIVGPMLDQTLDPYAGVPEVPGAGSARLATLLGSKKTLEIGTPLYKASFPNGGPLY